MIGKAGVGKSSLLRETFGVDVKVEHETRGTADINKGFPSQRDNRFILHDSMGFEAGEEVNFKLADDFLTRRREMSDVKEQIHAIWLCFQVPIAGGRILEAADDYFLKAKADGKLGGLPIVTVFTQYDTLESGVILDHCKRTRQAPASDFVKKEADGIFQKECVATLGKYITQSKIPCVRVSTKPNYKSTLDELVRLTEGLIANYITSETKFAPVKDNANKDSKKSSGTSGRSTH